jgi:hypothetical protein
MEILRVTLAAGERKSFHKEGTYLEVMKATAPFNVHFTDRAKGVFPCIGLEAGVYSEMPFQMMEVESDTAQTVTLMISSHRAGFRAGGAVAGGGSGGTFAERTFVEATADRANGGYIFTGNIGSSASTCPMLIIGPPVGKKLSIAGIRGFSGSSWMLLTTGDGIGTIEAASGVSPLKIKTSNHVQPDPIVKHGAGANNFSVSAAEAPGSPGGAAFNTPTSPPGMDVIPSPLVLTGTQRLYVFGNFNAVIQYWATVVVHD